MVQGEVAGAIKATPSGDTVQIDYVFVNNGRGPKHRETVQLGAGGVPVRWIVSGQSTYGNRISDTFIWENGQARWSGEADTGEAPAARPVLYVPANTSPWSTGLFARALLRAPGHTLKVLPSGTLRLERVEELEFGSGRRKVDVTVYALTGADLSPSYLALDRRGDLFAQTALGVVTIREGFEAEAKRFLDVVLDLEVKRLGLLQSRLARRFDRPVRIENVRVLDVRTGRLGPLTDVTIHGERITAIGAGPPRLGRETDQVTIDGEGGTLMPGLHNNHAHTSLYSGPLYLAAGVTSVRDMGGDAHRVLELRQRLESGALPGPRITLSGFIEGRSAFSQRSMFIADTLEEALAQVAWYADHGYFQVKLYNSLDPLWVKPIAQEAHRRGLRVTGHVPAFTTASRVIEDGYDEIAHINQLMLEWLLEPGEDTRTALRINAMARAAELDLTSPKVRRTVEVMQRHGVTLDTTAVIFERLMLSRAGQVQPGDVDYIEHVPVGYQRQLRRTLADISSPVQDEAFRRGFAKVLETIKLLHDSGIPLLPGTDDDTGFTVHRELELYAQAGIPVSDVLRLATLDSAAHVRREDELGSVEVGKLADLILVPGDPTRDLRTLKQVRMVVRGGAIYFPHEIYESLGIRPFGGAPGMQLGRTK